jgi:hypothetical protein
VTLTGTALQIDPAGQSTTAECVTDVLAMLIDWLDTVRVRCLPKTVVPGTTTAERRRLAALGGIVRSIARPQRALDQMPSGVREWIEGAPAAPHHLVERVEEALRRDGAAFFARVYEGIVRGAHRRALGTYFTPQATVDWMLAEWSAKEGRPRSVVDVGAGVGVFTASALARWRPGLICAVDVNPVTLGLLTALYMTMEKPPWGIRMVLADYTTWKGHAHQTAPCVTIGNPPYTRLQLLPKPARMRLRAEMPECGTRAGLSTWILASALGRLRAQDGLLFLLPRNWMEADYATGIRARLWGARYRRVELTCLSGDIFGDARIDAVALLVGARKRAPQPFVIRQAADDSGSPTTHRSGPTPTFVERNHNSIATHRARNPSRSSPGVGRTVPLSKLATVRRGTATGANQYFVLSEATLRTWRLPPSSVYPLVRRLRDFCADAITEADIAALGEHVPRWLLLVRKSQVDRQAALRRFVAHGVKLGVADRHLCRQRSPWYDLHCDVNCPDVIVGPMSRGRFRFVENAARAAITNNLFGLTWAAEVTKQERATILRWLRSDVGQAALRAQCRSHAGGLRKLEPRAFGAVPVTIIQ